MKPFIPLLSKLILIAVILFLDRLGLIDALLTGELLRLVVAA